MKPIRFLGHPLHPAVIHFPMAFLALPFPLELVALWTHREECLLFALAAESLGVAAALLAIVTGIIDFAALKGRRDEAIPRATLRMGFSGTGFAFLLFGGWLGADLIFRFGLIRSER